MLEDLQVLEVLLGSSEEEHSQDLGHPEGEAEGLRAGHEGPQRAASLRDLEGLRGDKGYCIPEILETLQVQPKWPRTKVLEVLGYLRCLRAGARLCVIPCCVNLLCHELCERICS